MRGNVRRESGTIDFRDEQKAILKLDSEEVSECILENTLRGAQKVTFKELVRQYPVR